MDIPGKNLIQKGSKLPSRWEDIPIGSLVRLATDFKRGNGVMQAMWLSGTRVYLGQTSSGTALGLYVDLMVAEQDFTFVRTLGPTTEYIMLATPEDDVQDGTGVG